MSGTRANTAEHDESFAHKQCARQNIASSSSAPVVTAETGPAMPSPSAIISNTPLSDIVDTEVLKQWEQNLMKKEVDLQLQQQMLDLERRRMIESNLRKDEQHTTEPDKHNFANAKKARDEEFRKERAALSARVMHMIKEAEKSARHLANFNCANWALELKNERWVLAQSSMLTSVRKQPLMQNGRVEFAPWCRPGVTGM